MIAQQRERRPYRAARVATSAGLLSIGLIGLANSWGSLYSAASTHMAGTGLPDITVGRHTFSTAGASLPVLLDVLIAVASSRYVIGVKEGRAVGGWRAAAHAAIAGTVLMNALAATRLGDVPWHVIAPLVLSVVIELVAREILGTLREVTDARADAIPLRLWLTCPAESARVAWRMARTGQRAAGEVRRQTEQCAAVRDDLRIAMPGLRRYRDRTRILRRLWSGALDPDTLTALIVAHEADPRALLRACLRAVACPALAVPEAHALPAVEASEGMPREASEVVPPTRHEASRHEASEACPIEAGHEAPGIEACPVEAPVPPAEGTPEAPDPEAPMAGGTGVPPARSPEARPRTPRGTTPTIEDLRAALADGSLTAISRNPIKNRFGLRSNSTADRLIKAFREAEQETTKLRAIS